MEKGSFPKNILDNTIWSIRSPLINHEEHEEKEEHTKIFCKRSDPWLITAKVAKKAKKTRSLLEV